MIVHYKRDTMIRQAIGCVIVAVGCAWMFTRVEHLQLRILFGGLAIALPIVATGLGIRVTGNLVALEGDDRGLTIRTLWRERRLDWRNIKSVHRETIEQTSGFVTRTIAWYLVITAHEGDGFEQSFKLNEKLLDMPQRSIPALIEQIAAFASAGPRTRASMAQTDDGVIARYITEQANGPAAAPATRAVFGRKVA